MTNPFEVLEARLINIEALLLDLKHPDKPNVPATQDEDLMTVKQAAKLLDLSVATIYCKISRDELPAIKGPKRTYFSKTELLNYLKQSRRNVKPSEKQEEKDPTEFLQAQRKRKR